MTNPESHSPNVSYRIVSCHAGTVLRKSFLRRRNTTSPLTCGLSDASLQSSSTRQSLASHRENIGTLIAYYSLVFLATHLVHATEKTVRDQMLSQAKIRCSRSLNCLASSQRKTLALFRIRAAASTTRNLKRAPRSPREV